MCMNVTYIYCIYTLIGQVNIAKSFFNLFFFCIPEYAERRCSREGKWEGKLGAAPIDPVGWTNYTPCFPPEMRQLFKKVYANENDVKVI